MNLFRFFHQPGMALIKVGWSKQAASEFKYAEKIIESRRGQNSSLPLAKNIISKKAKSVIEFDKNLHFQFLYGKDKLQGQILTGAEPTLVIQLEDSDSVYGLGAASSTRTLPNDSFELMNRDSVMGTLKKSPYASLPAWWVRQGSGQLTAVVLMTGYPVKFKKSEKKIKAKIKCASEQAPIFLALMSGSAEFISRKTAMLLGFPANPPAWALGLFQSRWSYKSAKEVLKVAQRYRRELLPCDGIYLDIHYMDDYKVFTWNHGKFRDPRFLHEKLQNLGMRTVSIVDPGIKSEKKYEVYEDAVRKKYLATNSNGKVFTGKVWPGKTVFPDFYRTDVREFWANNHATLFHAGVSGIWNDMNDPVLEVNSLENPLEADIQFTSGSHRKLRNQYANKMAEASNKAFEKFRPSERSFVLSRSGTLGIQSHAWLWTGDNHSKWRDLRANLYQVIHYGLCGVPFSGADIGGFAAGPGVRGLIKLVKKKELFIRWMELGCLMPLFRIHTCLHSHRQEPWSFGKQVLAKVRLSIELRYRLTHYFLYYSRRAAETGIPIIRPLWYNHSIKKQEAGQDQFMVGKELLAVPALRKGARKVSFYLPEGGWFDYYSGEHYAGDAYYAKEAHLGQISLFVRSGTVLPMTTVAQNIEESIRQPFLVEVFPAAKIKGQVFLDDGITIDSGYFMLQFSGSLRTRDSRLAISWKVFDRGFKPSFTAFTLRLPERFGRVVLNGEPVQVSKVYAAHEQKTYGFQELQVPLTKGSLTAFEV